MGPGEALVAAQRLGVTQVLPTHHEAVFSDPLAEHVITTAPANPAATFAARMAQELPAVRYQAPSAGDVVALA
jgi:hypothetical protein